MTTAVTSALDRVGATLLDEDQVRWTAGENVEWLNDGQREIARRTPNGYVTETDLACVAGAIQELPADCISLTDIPYNVDADGTPGRAIRAVDEMVLRAYRPLWLGESAAEAKHYIYNYQRDRYRFFLYPGLAEPAKVHALYRAIPPYVDLDGDVLVAETYIGALVDYILARAYEKDSEDSSPDLDRAKVHWQQFYAGLSKGGTA